VSRRCAHSYYLQKVAHNDTGCSSPVMRIIASGGCRCDISGSDTGSRTGNPGNQASRRRPADGRWDWNSMKTTTLGRSGLEVSRIAFGTWQLGGDWGQFDEDAAITANSPRPRIGRQLLRHRPGVRVRRIRTHPRQSVAPPPNVVFAKPIPAASATQARSGYVKGWTQARPHWVSSRGRSRRADHHAR
jgi:hypothetical protein